MPATARVLVIVTVLAIVAAAALPLLLATADAEPQAEQSSPKPKAIQLKQVLLDTYDLTNAVFDAEEDLLAPGVAKDGIPALTDPDRAPAADAAFPPDDARVVEVVIGGEAVAYPLPILNFHEIANDTVGGVPVAVTYCPLCDSVSVFDRRLGDGGATLEFGVSGLLHNSNVVMYERSTMGLWSQVAMRCLSGPHVGESLDHLPVRVIMFERFKAEHPDGLVLTTDTGHERPYDFNPYLRYFEDPDRVFHEFEYDDRLPPKALGLGITAGDQAIFVRGEAAVDQPLTVRTELGPVTVRATTAGLQVEDAPEGVNTLQTFYHSWAAFHPQTAIEPAP